jgi:hypothetical protein
MLPADTATKVSLGLAAGALLISLFSFAVSTVVAVRAERLERQRDKREGRREQREMDDSAERRRGHLLVEGASTQGSWRADRVQFDYMVSNSGP